MNKIYVDELPKCCDECPCYSYEETEDEFWEFCSWCGYEFSEETCPLKPLTDRLAETAIAELEKVKDKINVYKKEHCLLFVEWDVIEKAVEFIDQQIKSLKGETK